MSRGDGGGGGAECPTTLHMRTANTQISLRGPSEHALVIYGYPQNALC